MTNPARLRLGPSGRRPLFVVLEIVVALGSIGLATGARFLIDLVFPNVVWFSLVFPALAGATMLAGWRSGLVVILGCQLIVWYFLVPVRGSFQFSNPSDAVSLVLATSAQLLLLWFIARYRAVQRESTAMLEAQREELNEALSRLKEKSRTDRLMLEQEASLRASRQNLEAIYQASGDGLALCEVFRNDEGQVVDYQVIEVNSAHADLTGATREQMLTKRVSAIAPPIDPRWFQSAQSVLDSGLMHEFDVRSPATGRWLNIRVSRVSETLIQQTFVDISARHELEEQRRSLLKEMNHRVMNNFQLVASLLHMGAAKAAPAAREQLRAAEGRIQVLGRLHSLLAYSESGGDIDAGTFIKEICGYLESAVDRPDAVTIVCEAGEITLPADKAVPLGFVVTELVTNSAKYAYPAPMAGTIRVSLLPRPEGWVLTVEDDGAGLEPGGAAATGGLGTVLVRRFVQQIGAELETTSGAGVRHRVTFKAKT